ncbi:MAG: hypothetical protein ACOYI8_00495 [Christensenellales bacterium]|jgi:hypothetical protein
MKGKRWIAALLALLLMLSAGLAMAEADAVPFGQQAAPNALREKLLSKDAAHDHITPNAGYQQCFQYDHDIRYEFVVNQPSVVTIEMRVKKSQRGPILFFSDSLVEAHFFYWAPAYNGRRWPHVYKLSAYVKPGKYYAGVASENLGLTYDLRVKTKEIRGLSVAGAIPEDAPFYIPGRKVRGVIGPKLHSADWYRLALDAPTRLSVTLKSTGNPIDLRIIDFFVGVIRHVDQENYKVYPRGRTYRGEVNLPAGVYHLLVGKDEDDYSSYNGLYELTLKKRGAAKTAVALRSNTVTVGFSKELEAYISPEYFPQFDDDSVWFKPVNNRYGVVLADGFFRGNKLGSLYVTVNGTVNGAPRSQRLKLRVVKNERVMRTTPETGIGVIWSAKKMYFKGDKFCVDMWVYNGLYSGGLTKIYDLHAEVRDTGTGDILSTLDRPRPIKTSIRYRKAGVITLRFPKNAIEEEYDLRGYDASLLNIDIDCNHDGIDPTA